MNSETKNLIHFMHGSILVSKIQKYFGIEIISFSKMKNNIEFEGDKTIKESDIDKNYRCYYKINSVFYYYFFSFLTYLGNEIFYILFLPILTWNFSDKIIYLTCASWGLSMYLGQASKEVFKIPRPLSPPVLKLEKQYAEEFGFPSTHSMAAMSISYTFILLAYEFSYFDSTRTDIKYCLIILASTLCILISLSRVYLGMHSILDCCGGLLVSFILSNIFIKIAFVFDYLVKLNIIYGLITMVICMISCFLYPTRDRWSTARADTILILGVVSGLTMGMSVKYAFNLTRMGKLTLNFQFTIKYLLLFWIRFIVGSLTVFFVRHFSKMTIFNLAIKYFNCKKYLSISDKIIQKIHLKELTQKNFFFEFCLYFFTYSNVSFTVNFLSFALFEIFNLK